MSDKSKAEKAEEWAMDYWDDPAIEAETRAHAVACGIAGFLAGRAHFIEHELRGLLELHHEDIYENTIDELIERARGEH